MPNFINFHSPSIKNNNAFYLPAGEARVRIVDDRDIAAVAVKALSLDGIKKYHNKTYLITGPEDLSYGGMAEILSGVTYKKIEYVNISDDNSRGGMKENGMDDWLIDTILELNDYFRKGYASQVSSAVKEVTGIRFKSFNQFASNYVEFFRLY